MKLFGRLRPSPAMAVAMFALFVALGGTSYAVISSSTVPDSLGVFHACLSRSSGGIRIVTKPSACHQAVTHGKHKTLGELPIAWSQTGPAGKNGTSGTNGTNGSPGISGYQLVQGSSVSNPAHTQTTVGASCPAGMKAIGGGGGGSSAGTDQNINSSFAYGDGTGWTVEENNTSGSAYTAYAFAVCANVAG